MTHTPNKRPNKIYKLNRRKQNERYYILYLYILFNNTYNKEIYLLIIKIHKNKNKINHIITNNNIYIKDGKLCKCE